MTCSGFVTPKDLAPIKGLCEEIRVLLGDTGEDTPESDTVERDNEILKVVSGIEAIVEALG